MNVNLMSRGGGGVTRQGGGGVGVHGGEASPHEGGRRCRSAAAVGYVGRVLQVPLSNACCGDGQGLWVVPLQRHARRGDWHISGRTLRLSYDDACKLCPMPMAPGANAVGQVNVLRACCCSLRRWAGRTLCDLKLPNFSCHFGDHRCAASCGRKSGVPNLHCDRGSLVLVQHQRRCRWAEHTAVA